MFAKEFVIRKREPETMENQNLETLVEISAAQAAETNSNGKEPPVISPTVPPESNLGELDRIRDIIFGNQQRDLDLRFRASENKFESLSAHYQKLLNRQEQDKLEVDSHLNITEDRLRREMQALEASIQENRREMRLLEARFDNYRSEVYERLGALERNFAEKMARLEKNFVEQTEQLLRNKADSFDIGELLMDAGIRLRREKQSRGQG
jgi:hypothetical protein